MVLKVFLYMNVARSRRFEGMTVEESQGPHP
ncbi:uncharacterized protein METZ01_LOCUS320141 [marine metagenome]|uniref:Uncharacterized protein n=1 Tax=marine metagenome TaxID=408172 RepID=A0A382P3C5_9ZZZZ